jgi:hypothetical protein
VPVTSFHNKTDYRAAGAIVATTKCVADLYYFHKWEGLSMIDKSHSQHYWSCCKFRQIQE